MTLATLTRNKHQLIAATSIGIAVAVMGIKYVAYLMTGSVALFSDALESIVNVLTAVAALIAIRIGSQPSSSERGCLTRQTDMVVARRAGQEHLVLRVPTFNK